MAGAREISRFLSPVVNLHMPRKSINMARLVCAAVARWSPVGRRICVACGHRVAWFLPHRGGWKHAPPLIRELNVIGSDLDHVECPACGASDRVRHMLLYMTATAILDVMADKTVVHFAPERAISRRILESSPARYVRCDLFQHRDNAVRVDIRVMPFPDASADLVIANHVLEHVADDLQAIAEIRRVLKPGGKVILQTPYSAVLHTTWSDAGVDNDLARLQAYGQEDHVRLYGSDIIERIESGGLKSRVESHHDLLPGYDPEIYGVNADEPFFLFERP